MLNLEKLDIHQVGAANRCIINRNGLPGFDFFANDTSDIDESEEIF